MSSYVVGNIGVFVVRFTTIYYTVSIGIWIWFNWLENVENWK